MANELEGLWRSRGYGTIAQVDGGSVRLIEQTGKTCLLSDSYSTEEFVAEIEGKPDFEAGRFTLGHEGTLSTITFDRLDDGGFNSLCPEGLTRRSSDPELNFEVLWQTFDEHYAFFTEREVDWDAAYNRFRPQITKNTPDQALAEILGRMLEELGDAHVGLYRGDDDLVSVGTRVRARLAKECREVQGTACNIRDYVRGRFAAHNAIIKKRYLENRFETVLGGDVIWGQIGESTGYFRIDSMAGLASTGYSAEDDLTAVGSMLDGMLQGLGHLPRMIVDVRLNGGGYDAVAAAIASRFATSRQIFGSKRAHFGGEHTTPQDLVVDPGDRDGFQGEVAVLISSETASAAEIFTMAMRALPQVTLVGTPTEGILSDEFYRYLPNGWEFSLSNEIYLAHDGALFEAVGIPPDVKVPFLARTSLEDEVDEGIEAALAHFSNDKRHAKTEAR
ncbi:MAG: S41 family peptidase [Geminicoccaceae bacterium]